MTEWEYTQALLPWGKGTEKKLNELGSDGWEAVGVAPGPSSPLGVTYLVLLKRPRRD